MRSFAAIAVLLATSGATKGEVSAVGTPSANRVSIDTFCASLDKAKHSALPSFYGAVQPDPEREGTWKAFSTKAQLNKAVESGVVFDHAYMWKRREGVLVLLALTSASGDWIHYMDYCFRADGTLARSTSTLNTFNVYHPDRDVGPVSKEKKRYFDVSGRQIGFSTRLLDLKTRKPAPELERNFMDQDEPKVRRTEELPFSALTGGAAQPGIAPDDRSPSVPARRSTP
jgi:hypothetical protein